MLEHIFFDILEMTIAASILMLLTECLLPVLDKRYSLGWRKAFWILVGIRLLIPYNFSWDSHALHLFKLEEGWKLAGMLVPAAAVLSALWFAGFVLYLRHQHLFYRHFLKKIEENGRVVEEGEECRLLRQVREELGIKRQIGLYRCSSVHTPMLTGVFNPMLILPEESYESAQLKLILYHECIHMDNMDLVYKGVMLLAEAVHWFNPLVHHMVCLSYRDVEMFCDQCVTEDMDKTQRGMYGKAILDAAGRKRDADIAMSTCFYGNVKVMRQRVEHLFYMDKKKDGAGIFIGMLLLFIFLGIFIKCGV